MECRNFELTLISAKDLQKMRHVCKMRVHCRVWVAGQEEKRTPTDTHSGENPAWNHTMNFTVRESLLGNYNAMLVVKLYRNRKLGDRYIGEVHTPIKELFDCARPTGGAAVLTFPVQKGSVNSQGQLMLSYKFGEKVSIDKLLLAETLTTDRVSSSRDQSTGCFSGVCHCLCCCWVCCAK